MGPYLSAPIVAKESTEGAAGGVRYGATHMQGWRNTMEDAHLTDLRVEGGAQVFGVFDGHGGKEVAIFAARHFVSLLTQNSKYREGNYDTALKETFLSVDTQLRTVEGAKEVFRIQRDLPDSAPVDTNIARDAVATAGCTAVVALITAGTLYVANAGDSRAVLGRKGRAVEMSQDHKPDLPEELARITGAGACVVEGRVNGNINLSRSLGDLEYKTVQSLPAERQAVTAMPDVRSVVLTPEDDFLVMCCDGIWDILSSQECVSFIHERLGQKDLKTIAEEICDRCLAHTTTEYEGRGCDNMTVVLVAFSPS